MFDKTYDLVRVEDIHVETNKLRLFKENVLEAQELRSQIKQWGILVPILLHERQVEGETRLCLVNGLHRLMFCKQLEIKEIPAIIIRGEISDAELLSLSAICNRDVPTTNSEHQAQLGRIIALDANISLPILAGTYGMTSKTIEEFLGFTGFSDDIKAQIRRGEIPVKYARLLAKVFDEAKLPKLIAYSKVMPFEDFKLEIKKARLSKQTFGTRLNEDVYEPVPKLLGIKALRRELATLQSLEGRNYTDAERNAYIQGILFSMSMDETTKRKRIEERNRIVAEHEQKLERLFGKEELDGTDDD